MPLRTYRCRAGHTIDLFQRMEEGMPQRCEELVPETDDGDTVVACGQPFERVLNSTQRPIVRDGTRLHHGTRGVKL